MTFVAVCKSFLRLDQQYYICNAMHTREWDKTSSIQPEQNQSKSGGEGVLTGNRTILLGVVEGMLSNIVYNVKLALPRLHQ